MPDRRGNRLQETLDLLKAYAKQETVEPLKGAGRWLGFGIGGAVCLGFGIVLLLLSLLRALQEETGDVFDGNWSWAPYAITLVVCLLVSAIALSRVKKTTLQKRSRP